MEFGEDAKAALKRELKEELNLSIGKMTYMGMVENIFIEEKEKHHEISLVFKVAAGEAKDKSAEDHLDFFFFDQKRFAKETIYPLVMRDATLKWLKDKKLFWKTFNAEPCQKREKQV